MSEEPSVHVGHSRLLWIVQEELQLAYSPKTLEIHKGDEFQQVASKSLYRVTRKTEMFIVFFQILLSRRLCILDSFVSVCFFHEWGYTNKSYSFIFA